MIAILEQTQSNVQQNIEQLQTPTMGVTINKKSTTIEPKSELYEKRSVIQIHTLYDKVKKGLTVVLCVCLVFQSS